MKNKPIYPNSKLARDGDLKYIQTTKGITLLEHYAGLAMQGLLASGQYDLASSSSLAEFSVDYAKQLIKELKIEL